MGDFLYYERFVWFDQQIKQKRFPNARLLAEKFEISEKQARRTIVHFQDRMFAPIKYVPAQKGFTYSDASFELPRLAASQEELLAVLLARRLLTHAAGGHISEQIRRFGNKLLAGIDSKSLPAKTVDKSFSAVWHGHSPVPAKDFRLVVDALLKQRLLSFNYRAPGAGEVTRRTVEPHHLQHYRASWVLIAHCRLRQDWRKFYLARMNEIQMTAETFSPRPEEEWRPHCEGAFGIFQGEARIPVSLRFTPFRARWVREQFWHPAQTIQELIDGGLEITFPVADFREVKAMILQFGADCEVLKPKSLRDQIQKEIQKMAGVYRAENEKDEKKPDQGH